MIENLKGLKETPSKEYNYLVDVTAVEYRDAERPIEVVYFLRSLHRRADLRVKVELPQDRPLRVDSVVPLWHGANWLEREVYDMFGISFAGHPRSEEHTSELQSPYDLVCRLLLEKKKTKLTPT